MGYIPKRALFNRISAYIDGIILERRNTQGSID
jgi:hypothetical protein